MDLIFPGLYPYCENANHNVLDELSLPGKFQNISFFGGKLMFLEQRVENHFWRT